VVGKFIPPARSGEDVDSARVGCLSQQIGIDIGASAANIRVLITSGRQTQVPLIDLLMFLSQLK